MLVIGGVSTSDLCVRAYVAERDAHLLRLFEKGQNIC